MKIMIHFLLGVISLLPNLKVAQQDAGSFPTAFISSDSIQLVSRTPYWVRVDIPKVPKSGNYVVQAGNWYMRNMQFYDHNYKLIGSGNNTLLNLNKTENNTLYIYYEFYDEKANIPFNIQLYPALEFKDKVNQMNILQTAFFTMLSFPLLVSLFFAIKNTERVYLFYSLYILSVFWFFGYQYGLIGKLFKGINHVSPIWIWLSGFTITLFYALFSVHFLNLKERDVKAYKIIKAGIIYILGLTFASLVLYIFRIDAQHALWYKLPTIAIQLVLIFAVLLRVFQLQGHLKNYYLASVILLIVISIGGQIMSTIQLVNNFNYIIQAGLVMEIFILSIGLAVRVNLLREEKDMAQIELISQLRLNESLQKQYTEQLEATVSSRTQNLKRQNKEIQVLLKEIHHRVKNNLQMIISLLNMQQRRTNSEASKLTLLSAKNRIKSIALIHEHLYSHNDYGQIALHKYLPKLINLLISSMHKGYPIKTNIAIDEVNESIQTSISIGLIMTELITNSLKYALRNHPAPELEITLEELNNSVVFSVKDNGNGIDDTHANGMGYSIINGILDSAESKLEQNVNDEGFTVKVTLKL